MPHPKTSPIFECIHFLSIVSCIHVSVNRIQPNAQSHRSPKTPSCPCPQCTCINILQDVVNDADPIVNAAVTPRTQPIPVPTICIQKCAAKFLPSPMGPLWESTKVPRPARPCRHHQRPHLETSLIRQCQSDVVTQTAARGDPVAKTYSSGPRRALEKAMSHRWLCSRACVCL